MQQNVEEVEKEENVRLLALRRLCSNGISKKSWVERVRVSGTLMYLALVDSVNLQTRDMWRSRIQENFETADTHNHLYTPQLTLLLKPLDS